jgi:hypothetical protein
VSIDEFALIYKCIFISDLDKTVSGNVDSCGFWQPYKDEKCIKILDDEKLYSFDDAEEYCMEEDNGSILTIHSKEEQEFVSKFVFKTHGIVDDIWIGMKRNNSNKYMWMDGSEPIFTNWAKGSPSNESGNNCALILSRSDFVGKWIDVPCKKKNFAVCQKKPALTTSLLHKLLLDTKKELEQTRKISNENDLMFGKYLRHLSNNQWINMKLFSDSDGNKKAFVLPLTNDYYGRPWKDAVTLCTNLNGTLVEIDSWQKQLLFNSFLGQLGSEGTNYKSFWVHSRKDSSGKWKWIRSGKEVFSNWHPKYPKSNNDFHLAITLEPNANFGKFFNPEKKSTSNVICELPVDY